jgi:hypothetical protein
MTKLHPSLAKFFALSPLISRKDPVAIAPFPFKLLIESNNLKAV